MSIVEFRRLSSDPREAAVKVKDMIDLLSEDSAASRVEGVSAWRKNPLNMLYQSISREALEQGRPVEQMLTSRRAANKDVFTLEL